jgi:adenylate kinase family enzyme
MIDEFPRYIEQLESWNRRLLKEELPFAGGVNVETKPDVVLSLRVNRDNAKTRHVVRARDKNDQADKFERRFAEYELDTLPADAEYRQRGVLIDVSTM